MPPRDLYNPVPEVRPREARDPSERVHIAFPDVNISNEMAKAMQSAGHMLGVVGSAQGFLASSIDKAGKQFEGAGDEIFKRAVGLQELQNETTAKKASIEYDTWATQKQVEYSQKQGDAASEATLKAHMEELQKKQAEMKGKLGNQSTQRHFDDLTLRSMVGRFGSAAAHAASETRKAANGASEARIKLNMDAYSKTDDMQESQRIMDATHKEFYGTRVPLMGWSRDQADKEWRDITSRMTSTKIVGFSDERPMDAMKMLEENKHLMSGEDYEKVKNTVTNNLRNVQSRVGADEIQERMPDAPYEKKLEEADKKAESLNSKDPMLPKAMRDQVTIRHNQHRKDEEESRARNLRTAWDAVYGYEHPEGRRAITIDEAKAIPGFKEAFDSLHGKDRKDIEDAIVKNSKRDFPRTNETRRRVNEIMGWTLDSAPQELREKFLKHNFYDEKIPGDDRDALFALQRKKLEKGFKAGDSVEVNKARSAALSSGVLLPDSIRTWQSPSIRSEFDGALYQTIQEKIKEKKGVALTDQERISIVKQLLANDPNSGFDLGSWGRWLQSPRYQTVQKEKENEITLLKQRYPGLSEAQLDQVYSKIMWQRYSKEYDELEVPKAPKPTVPTSQ